MHRLPTGVIVGILACADILVYFYSTAYSLDDKGKEYKPSFSPLKAPQISKHKASYIYVITVATISISHSFRSPSNI